MSADGIDPSAMGLPASLSGEDLDQSLVSELTLFILKNRFAVCEKIAASEADRERVLIRLFYNRCISWIESGPHRTGSHIGTSTSAW